MALLETAPIKNLVDYGLYDADEHYYEAQDALTRHLDPKFRRDVKWVDVEGRKTLLLANKLVTVVPNPTYDPVGAPGSLEKYFRGENYDGVELRDMVVMQPIQPEYRNRDARLARMDTQGVDFSWLMPSLGLGIEEMLSFDPEATHAIFTAYNKWLDDDWGYDRDGRLQTGPLITFLDPLQAEAELARVLDKGAKMITLRPAPTRAPGRHRSPADRSHDRFWAMAQEANLVVAIHAADAGYAAYSTDWGDSDRYMGMKSTKLNEVMGVHIERPIYDMIAAMVCHGLFDRFPGLRVAALENGSSWVPELHHRFKVSFGKTPQNYITDPSEAFREHVWVAPFFEDDVLRLRDVHGADRMLLGSDWPHPEGLPTPARCVEEFQGFSYDDLRLVLRENLRGLSGR